MIPLREYLSKKAMVDVNNEYNPAARNAGNTKWPTSYTGKETPDGQYIGKPEDEEEKAPVNHGQSIDDFKVGSPIIKQAGSLGLFLKKTIQEWKKRRTAEGQPPQKIEKVEEIEKTSYIHAPDSRGNSNKNVPDIPSQMQLPYSGKIVNMGQESQGGDGAIARQEWQNKNQRSEGGQANFDREEEIQKVPAGIEKMNSTYYPSVDTPKWNPWFYKEKDIPHPDATWSEYKIPDPDTLSKLKNYLAKQTEQSLKKAPEQHVRIQQAILKRIARDKELENYFVKSPQEQKNNLRYLDILRDMPYSGYGLPGEEKMKWGYAHDWFGPSPVDLGKLLAKRKITPNIGEKGNIVFDKVSKEYIPGGKAEGMNTQDIANKHKIPKTKIDTQMEMGREVEKEHTPRPEVASEIAKDHLDEFPDYYTGLKEMEKRLKANLEKKSMNTNTILGVVKKTVRSGENFDSNRVTRILEKLRNQKRIFSETPLKGMSASDLIDKARKGSLKTREEIASWNKRPSYAKVKDPNYSQGARGNFSLVDYFNRGYSRMNKLSSIDAANKSDSGYNAVPGETIHRNTFVERDRTHQSESPEEAEKHEHPYSGLSMDMVKKMSVGPSG